MASLSDAELKQMTQEERVTALGMRTEQLTGKSLHIEFNPDEEERFTYPWAPEVDFNKRTEIDTDDICLLYTSPSPRDATLSRMPSSA